MLSNKILEKIESDHIKPKAKCLFVAKECLYWIVFAFAIFVGSIAISLIIFALKNNDWDIYSYVSANVISFAFITMPYFWIGIMLFFIVLAFIDFKYTKHGYKYKFLFIAVSAIMGSLIFGAIFYSLGFADKIEKNFVQNSPIYKNMFCENSKAWNQPSRGVIMGIIEKIDFGKIIVKDANSFSWQISYDTNLIGRQFLTKDNKIKILGDKTGENAFFAKEIRESRCGCVMKNCSCGNNERKVLNIRNTSCGMNN